MISDRLAAGPCALLLLVAIPASLAGFEPCRITIVDDESGWPVPLVELRTVHNVRFISDNAGNIAMDLPELMGKECWFTVIGHGYEVPKDGFGYRGVRLTPRQGAELRIEVERTIIARRMGRLTGGGLFAESQKLGLEVDWEDSPILGCDSVQNAVYQGQLFWAWGDTSLPHYPLGIFHMSSATTAVQPLKSEEPPLRLEFDYFTREDGRPRGVARMPGSGPTWVSGYTSLPAADGSERLVGIYRKIEAPLDTYEVGQVVWDDETREFEKLRTIWTRSEEEAEPPLLLEGHPVRWTDDSGKEWALFGDPLPQARCPATFEAWKDRSTWERLEPQESFRAAGDDSKVVPHRGSITWNPFRKRWITVFTQYFGKPSAIGELWYAEAREPNGPWGPAVKVLGHEDYTFYNPRIHPEFTRGDAPRIFFEGTYTMQFSGAKRPTPRYDYNQILYRLDLDDPKLRAAWLE